MIDLCGTYLLLQPTVRLFADPKYFSSIFLLVLTITGCQQAHPENKRLNPLPQDPLAQVYFNHTESSEYQEPYREKTRLGDDLEQQIVDAISQAKSTIDVAVQELRLPKIAQALSDKQKAGVKVRVILENAYSTPWSSFTSAQVSKLTPRERGRYNEFRQLLDINKDGQLSDEEIKTRDALVILRAAKIPWIDDTADGSKGSSLMHHKFVIVDNRIVIITSANFTLSDIHGDFTNPNTLGNANNLLKFDSPDLGFLFTEEFNIMWGDGPKGKLDSKFGVKKPQRTPQPINLGDNIITVNFSPTSPTISWSKSSNGLIGSNLNTAVESIDMALFDFSEQRLANILDIRHQKDVKIRALLDPQFAYRPYSEALDMMGVTLSNVCKNEVDNRPWQDPITTVGVPLLPKGDLLHHKFAVIDNQTVITGSHNWSKAANHNNDETVLVIQSPIIAAHYQREFQRLYAQAKLGLPPKFQAQIQAQAKDCPPPQTSEKVNLNTAKLSELETLPGVGEKLAQQIILFRQQKPFTSLEDLDSVPGVGASLLEKLRERVTW